MHDLQAERFYDETAVVNGRRMSDGGPTKTFPLRGIKESPPYLHDGRLPTLDDAVEFFNLVLRLRLTDEEKGDLVRFLYTL
jgi:cytochrome c peroxidase